MFNFPYCYDVRYGFPYWNVCRLTVRVIIIIVRVPVLKFMALGLRVPVREYQQ